MFVSIPKQMHAFASNFYNTNTASATNLQTFWGGNFQDFNTFRVSPKKVTVFRKSYITRVWYEPKNWTYSIIPTQFHFLDIHLFYDRLLHVYGVNWRIEFIR